MLSLTVLHSSKDVSSPIADEVEKTETERTAQGEASTSAVSLPGSCGIDFC